MPSSRCARCGRHGEQPICPSCGTAAARLQPFLLDPRLAPGPGVLELLGSRGVAVWGADGTVAIAPTRPGPGVSEGQDAACLHLMGFSAVDPPVTAEADAAVLHAILRRSMRRRPSDPLLRARLARAFRAAASIPAFPERSREEFEEWVAAMETVPAVETAPAAPSSASDEDVSLPAPDKASVDEAAEEAAAPPADGVQPDTIRADEPATEPVMEEDRPDGEPEALDAQEANLAAREETLRTPEEDAAARARDVGEPPVPAVPSEPVGIDAPEPTLADAGSALLHQAQDHLEAHDLEAALDCYDAILETSPGDGEALFNKAEVLSMLGRIEEAIACFGQLLEGDPEHRVALAEMAHLLLEDGQLEEGLRTLRASIALDPGRAPEFLDRARRLRGDGKRDEAVLLYNAVLDAEEDNLDAAIGLGDTLLEMDDAAMASHVFTRAATRHPRNPVALHRKGLMLDREGRWGAAVQLFNRAIALEWNFVDAWVSKGDILRAHDRAHDALLCYAKALEFDGDRAEAWMGKALAHRALGEAEAAAEAARRAKALDPTLPDLAAFREALDAQAEGPPPKGVLGFFGTPQAEAEDAEVLCQLAELALEAGDAPMALIRFEEACAVDPRNAKAWTGKGIALQHMERYEKALACYDEALALDPQFELARRWRETCLKRMGGS